MSSKFDSLTKYVAFALRAKNLQTKQSRQILKVIPLLVTPINIVPFQISSRMIRFPVFQRHLSSMKHTS